MTCNRYERREWLPYPGWNHVTYVPPGETPKVRWNDMVDRDKLDKAVRDAQHWDEPPRIR